MYIIIIIVVVVVVVVYYIIVDDGCRPENELINRSNLFGLAHCSPEKDIARQYNMYTRIIYYGGRFIFIFFFFITRNYLY